jgi:hypothetical protein
MWYSQVTLAAAPSYSSHRIWDMLMDVNIFRQEIS